VFALIGARPGRAVGRHILLAVVALAFAACSGLLPPAEPADSAEEPVERMPLYAGLHVTAAPAVAAAPLSIELLDPAEPAFSRTERFAVGVVVLAGFPVSSGTYRLVIDGGRCSLELDLAPQRETDVLLGLEDGACEIEVIGVHGEEVQHAMGGGGSINVTVVGGGLVEVRSLDVPAHPVPSPTPPDEGGVARLDVRLPGRYAVVLLRDGVEVDRAEVEVERREPAGDLVEITLGARD